MPVPTVILCGGRGTRLRELTEDVPKVMVEVGGRPILWHLLQGYAHHGFRDFILALGYLAGAVEAGFAPGSEWRDPAWHLRMVNTGDDTGTGGRLFALRDLVDGDTFMATYGDAVSDVDLEALLRFHQGHGRVATLTVVRPRLPFGLVHLADGDRVDTFTEKPRVDGWVNGGFFVFDRRVFEYLSADATLEREPLERLAADDQLRAFRHEGFWGCMDTYKDNVELNAAWDSGRAPWAAAWATR